MLTIKITQTPEREIFELQGSIDENVIFDEAFKDISGKKIAEFNCAAVIRINSVGVKNWILFFTKTFKMHRRIRFTDLSPALVEQANLVMNFLPVESIESVILPFICPDCNNAVFFSKTQSAIVGVDLDRVKWPCPVCGKTDLEFDDVPDEYLAFWNRPAKV